MFAASGRAYTQNEREGERAKRAREEGKRRELARADKKAREFPENPF